MAKTQSGWRLFGQEQPREVAEWCIWATVQDQAAYMNSHWSYIPQSDLNVGRCADVANEEILETFFTEKEARQALKNAR